MRNYRIQRIRILPPTVSRPFSAFYTVNWIEIERPYSSHSEKKTKKQSQTLSRRRRRRCTCRQTTRISLYFFEPKNRKTEKQFFLIYVGDIFRGPDSIVISHGLFQEFFLFPYHKNVTEMFPLNITRIDANCAELFLPFYTLPRRKKKMWSRRKQDPGWANFG